MPTGPLISPERLGSLATKRTAELFYDDVESRRPELCTGLEGRRVLVVGGAGSIGSATVAALAEFNPLALHVVDQSENNLAELVRDLRSSIEPSGLSGFRALPLDYGSPVMRRFLAEMPRYDLILNFAALKHVRSEKDVYSLLQMLDTNVVKQTRFIEWLRALGNGGRYFSVSTDKAANPVNLMGATKRLMEHIIFSEELAADGMQVTSARFANVAFSDGSLLHSFSRRLDKRQPLAVPRDTRRYFVSLREAAQICMLAAVCGPPKRILIPRLDPSEDLCELESVAAAFLRYHGLEPEIHTDPLKAKRAVEGALARGRYPLLLTPLDTSGEKPYEEFLAAGEQTEEIGMRHLLAVRYRPDSKTSIRELAANLERGIADHRCTLDKSIIVRMIASAIPQFHHIETDKTLDDRM